MLIDVLGAQNSKAVLQQRSDVGIPEGKLDPTSIARALTAAMPENAILVDESLTTGRETLGLTAGRAAPRRSPEYGRLHRIWNSGRHGRCAGLPRSPCLLHGRGWKRNVHHSVALDPGAREP